MASEIVIGMEQLLESVAALGAEDLILIIDAASTRLKKVGTKSLPKGKRVSTGEVPSQLMTNNHWVKYIEGDAKMNGWEAFVRTVKTTDKVTGKKTEVDYDMACSVEGENGEHVFSNTGETFSYTYAMSYSKMLKDRGDPLYTQWLEAFTEKVGDVAVPKGKKVVRKITAEEAAAEKAAKEEAKALEKAAEKAQKDAEKAMAKAAKDAEKEAEKARKDAEKAAKAKPVVQKAAPMVAPVKRLPSPTPSDASAASAALPASAVPLVALPSASPVVTMTKKAPGAPVKVKAVDTWKCEEDDVAVWEWKGETYMRDWRNFVWMYNKDMDAMGDFLGVYIFAKDVIEEAEEP